VARSVAPKGGAGFSSTPQGSHSRWRKGAFNGNVRDQPVKTDRGGRLVAGLLVLLGFAVCNVSVADAGAKKYYLTPAATFDGNEALTACDNGYHMASLGEIFDTTNLKYDTSRGFTRADSGSGPPSDAGGWIRTGQASEMGNIAGTGNCSAWTSDSNVQFGTRAFIEDFWGDPVHQWRAATLGCDEFSRVWRVRN